MEWEPSDYRQWDPSQGRGRENYRRGGHWRSPSQDSWERCDEQRNPRRGCSSRGVRGRGQQDRPLWERDARSNGRGGRARGNASTVRRGREQTQSGRADHSLDNAIRDLGRTRGAAPHEGRRGVLRKAAKALAQPLVRRAELRYFNVLIDAADADHAHLMQLSSLICR